MTATIEMVLSHDTYGFGGLFQITTPGSYNGEMRQLLAEQAARAEIFLLASNGYYIECVNCPDSMKQTVKIATANI